MDNGWTEIAESLNIGLPTLSLPATEENIIKYWPLEQIYTGANLEFTPNYVI